MSKFIVLIFCTALFFGCTDSLALKQKSGQDFILVTKHPLISEKELLLESIIDLLDAGIVNQSSLSHIFSLPKKLMEIKLLHMPYAKDYFRYFQSISY